MASEPGHGSEGGWNSDAPIPIGLGGSVFGWIVEPAATDAILDRFFEIGGRFIDTADGYSHAARPTGGDSESLIGSWVKRRGVENEVRIITKVGLCPGVEGLAPEVVARAVDASLDRLGVPVAEAVLAHADDGVTPAEEIAEGLAAIADSSARQIGVSRFTPKRLLATQAALRRASSSTLISLVQEEFSLAERGGFNTLLDCRDDDPALRLVSSASLARGFLTGKFENASTRVGARQLFVSEHYGKITHCELLDGLRHVAREHGVSPGGIALRWLVQHEAVSLPLASVTRPGQLDAFSEAAALELSVAQWGLLDNLSAAAAN